MSQDLANLAIKVDSSSVAAASKDLDTLAGKAKATETATASMNSAFDKLRANWQLATVSAIAFWLAMQKAIQYMEFGAKALQVESSFKIMTDAAGVAGDAMVANMKKATRETIDDSALMAKAIKLMVMGYDSAQIERFSKNVIAASQIAGISVEAAFEAMSDAIANKMPRSLLKMGAITKDQMAVVTAAVAGGVDEMALYNLAMANLELRTMQLKGTQDQATIALQRFKAQAEETKENIGKGLIYILQGLAGEFQYLAAGALGLVASFAQLDAAIYSLRGKDKEAAEWTATANAAWAARNDLTKKATDNISHTAEVDTKATKSQIKNAEDKVAATYAETVAQLAKIKADEKAAAALEKAIEAAKKLREEWEKTNKELGLKIQSDGLDEFDAALLKIQFDTDKLKKEYEKLPKAIRDVANAQIDAAGQVDVDKLTREYVNKILDAYDVLAQTRVDDFKKYEKLIEEENSFAVDEHEKAVLTIIASEKRKLKEIAGMVRTGAITPAQGATGSALVKGNAVDATEKENQKLLAEQVDFYAKIDGFQRTAYEKELDLIELRRKANAKLYGDNAANAQASMETIAAVNKRYVKDTVDALGEWSTALEGISQLYAQGSEAQKTYHEMSVIFAVAQKALDTEGAVVKGVVAVINAMAEGDGYTAVLRGAAVAAVVAAYLCQIGASFSSSGGGGSSSSAANTPTYTGGSTVLGASDQTGSESIANSYKLMEDTYKMEDTKLTNIYNQLKDLNSNITGLVTSIFRMGGISTEGYESSWMPGSEVLQTGVKNTLTSAFNAIFLSMGDFISLIFGSNRLVENFMNVIFGKVETEFQSGGIEIGATIVKSIIDGASISAQQYAKIKTTTTGSFWGLFGGNSESTATQYSPLDQKVVDMLTKVFSNLGSTLVELAKGLGTDVQKVYDYVFETTQIDLNGMDAEKMSKALNDYFSKITDKAAEDLFGTIIQQYQKLNEALYETAVRLVNDKAIIEAMLKMTNQSFNGTIPEAIKFSETLITISGGLDKLTDSMQNYYDAFFSDAEKEAKLKEQMTAMMGQYGFDLPGTRSGYRDLVESLNLTTDAGQAAYVSLMQMSKGADEYYKYLEQNIKPENYATASEYQKALRGFAEGGISSGPESGYEARLHGTELVVSPRKSYPASVNNDNVILIEELRALRAEIKAGNKQVSENTLKTAKILDKVDNIGWPAERTG